MQQNYGLTTYFYLCLTYRLFYFLHFNQSSRLPQTVASLRLKFSHALTLQHGLRTYNDIGTISVPC